jgi:hypothetical protein
MINIGGTFIVECESCNENLFIGAEKTNFENISGLAEDGQVIVFLWDDSLNCDCGNEFIVVEYAINVTVNKSINWTNINIENAKVISEFNFTFE